MIYKDGTWTRYFLLLFFFCFVYLYLWFLRCISLDESSRVHFVDSIFVQPQQQYGILFSDTIFSFKSVPMIMLSHLRRRTRDYYGLFHMNLLSASAWALRERTNPHLSCACDTRWTLLPVLHIAIQRQLRLSPLKHKTDNIRQLKRQRYIDV